MSKRENTHILDEIPSADGSTWLARVSTDGRISVNPDVSRKELRRSVQSLVSRICELTARQRGTLNHFQWAPPAARDQVRVRRDRAARGSRIN